MAYEVHLANSVREKLGKMVKKNSLAHKRLIKLTSLRKTRMQ